MITILETTKCGIISGEATKFIAKIIEIIRNITPVLLIIMGALELAKATMAQKDDEIQKAQRGLVTKIVAGILVFFVIIFIQWMVNIVGTNTANNAFQCLNQVLNGTYTPDSAYEESCFGTEYSACITNNNSPNKQNECTESANKICGTNKPISNNTTTTNINSDSTTTTKPIIQTCYETCNDVFYVSAFEHWLESPDGKKCIQNNSDAWGAYVEDGCKSIYEASIDGKNNKSGYKKCIENCDNNGHSSGNF